MLRGQALVVARAERAGRGGASVASCAEGHAKGRRDGAGSAGEARQRPGPQAVLQLQAWLAQLSRARLGRRAGGGCRAARGVRPWLPVAARPMGRVPSPGRSPRHVVAAGGVPVRSSAGQARLRGRKRSVPQRHLLGVGRAQSGRGREAVEDSHLGHGGSRAGLLRMFGLA